MMNPFVNKAFQHLDRLAEWQAGRLPAPVTVEIQPTNACNHACPNCTFSHLVLVPGPKDVIDSQLLSSAIDQLADMGVKAITLSGGGEPLVYGRDRLLTMARQVRARGMDVALITNGSLLNNIEWLDLCEWVRISLDGYDVDTFAKYHGRSSGEFDKVLHNIHILGEARYKSLREGKKQATLGVGYLTDRTTTSHDIFAMAELCSGITGLSYLQFRPLVINMVADPSLKGGYGGFRNVEADAIIGWIHMAQERCGGNGFAVLASEDKYHLLATPGHGKTAKCEGHFLEAVIAADGCVYRCCHTAGQKQFRLGDLQQQTFHDIWHGARNTDIYDSVDPRATCPAACRLSHVNIGLEKLREPATHPNYI